MPGNNDHNIKRHNDPSVQRPGEKGPGKYHYNPGNMSGKTIKSCDDESDQENNADRMRSRHKEPDKNPS